MITTPTFNREEFAQRGDEIYERDVRSLVESDNEGKYIVIYIETGAYEVDADEISASDRLLSRFPNAQIWLRRIGSRHARRFGVRPHPVAQ